MKKLLILGHGRHGKDTMAEILHEKFGMKFSASSEAASDIFIFDTLKDKYGYKTSKECFEDRSNHRKEWYDLICDYNKEDKTRLAGDILEMSDCYVGMRDLEEFLACKEKGLFDLIVWVDRSKELPLETGGSFNIAMHHAHFIVDNNSTLEEFEEKVIAIGNILFK